MDLAKSVSFLALAATGFSQVSYNVSLFSSCELIYRIESAGKADISYLVYQQSGGEIIACGISPSKRAFAVQYVDRMPIEQDRP